MKAIALCLALALPAAAQSAEPRGQSPAERPVSGWVTRVDVELGDLWIGPMHVRVPAQVHDLDDVAVGDFVVVEIERRDGDAVASSLRIDADPR